MSGEKGRRTIKLETRHGSSRESRSRKDRPCDACRIRKSACVIAVKPPCRFCEIRGLPCTFDTKPRPRRRSDIPSSDDAKTPTDNIPTSNAHAGEVLYDKVSPQASRFPVPPRPLRSSSENSALQSPTSTISHNSPQTTRQYLSLQQLTSPTSPTPIHASLSSPHTDSVNDSSRDLQKYFDERRKNSLELGKNLTAHFVGLSGEQDTNLFSSIRYNVLNETKFIDFNIRQVYPGNPVTGTPPIHFSILHDLFPDRDQRAKRVASDAIESHVRSYGDALLRLYFRFVHPILPILSKAATVVAYATDKLSIPASLRGAIYGLACAFWTHDPLLKDIPPISQHELFEHAHAALNRELDSPKLSTLQACLLILHEQPDLSGTTESPRIWMLACQATGCAQALGLYQDPSLWSLPMWEKRIRKRLWWATYMCDIWSSICHGNPPHIPADSFDTSNLSIEDLDSDEDVLGFPGCHLLDEGDRILESRNAVRFLENVKLTKILANVLKDAFTLDAYRQTIQRSHVESRQYAMWMHKVELDRSLFMLPEYLRTIRPPPNGRSINAPMHLAFFAVKFLILRALMAPATSESKSDPTSRLCSHFKDALSEGEAFLAFVTGLTIDDLHVFWSRHSRTNLIISTDMLIYLFFCASTEDQVAKAYDMLQKYQDILRALAKVSDWSTMGLVRPSLLRTESFFHGAAEGIRLSGLK